MLNSVIIHHPDFGITVGGGEGYMAQIYKIFDNHLNLFLNPAKNVKKGDLLDYARKYYDVSLNNSIRPSSLLKRGLFINGKVNALIQFHRYSLHIVHFPLLIYIKPRLNVFKLMRDLFLYFIYPKCYSYFICNSEFTAFYLKEYWPGIQHRKIKILYPPVRLFEHDFSINKEKRIVICSRIVPDKKIDLVINTFIKNYAETDVKLIVVGSATSPEAEAYLDDLKSLSGENVRFFINQDRRSLEAIFARSLVFWHSKGYEESNPYFFEHFGITTVEAMSAGVIPVVINKGGQREIVDHGVNGYKWDTLEELVRYTNTILTMGEEERLNMSKNAAEKSARYGVEAFRENFNKILLEWKGLKLGLVRNAG
jgi:glycosyltransferase involved in cell wall biosynthesis